MLKSTIKGLLGSRKHLFNPHKKVSYSQTGEDLIIDFLFTGLGIRKPSYIDIGAHHPSFLSNTLLFYKKGSTGINIEPNPELIKHFKAQRPKDINLNIGVGSKSATLDFYIFSAATLSTFSKSEAEKYQQDNFKLKSVEKIPVDTLDNVLQKYYKGQFPHFMSIDVEGYEEEILNLIDFRNNFPLVICAETLSFADFGKGRKNQPLIDLICSKGYFVYGETYINTIFVHQGKWHELTAGKKN